MVQYYTVEEANQVLPRLTKIAVELRRVYQRIVELRPQIQSVLDKSRAGAGNSASSEMAMAFMRFDQLAEKITALGAELKDPATGLCDFLALHEGRDIYLCWRLGEEQIEWWHDLHTGFAGRRHVSDLIKG